MKFSAPAKIVLAGEHAILLDGKALSVAIDARSTAEFTVASECLHCKSASCLWCIVFSGHNEECICEATTSKNSDLSRAMLVCLESANCMSIESCNPQKNNIHIAIHIQMSVPFGGGLGSSAVLSSLLAGGIYRLKSGNLNLEAINEISFKCEQIFHASPSGMDNSTVVFGGCCLFERKKLKEKISMPSRLLFLIVNTAISKSTRNVLEAMREVCTEETRRKIMSQITDLVSKMKESLADLKTMRSLIAQNQQLLTDYGVSCKEIDEIVALGREFGMSGKLTGAGRGGCVVFPLEAQEASGSGREFMGALKERLKFDSFICGVATEGLIEEAE